MLQPINTGFVECTHNHRCFTPRELSNRFTPAIDVPTEDVEIDLMDFTMMVFADQHNVSWPELLVSRTERAISGFTHSSSKRLDKEKLGSLVMAMELCIFMLTVGFAARSLDRRDIELHVLQSL
jgi:hypothetical protein